MTSRRILYSVLAFLVSISLGRAETNVRIATYNIKLLTDKPFEFHGNPVSDVRTQGDRLEKLRSVLENLGADIIALQEINDRDSLKLLFDPAQWWLVIDDDSPEHQDVALAVRKTLNLDVGFAPADLDAEDEHFLFEGTSNEHFFPNRRDVLCVGVDIPGRDEPILIMVVHAKSRLESRVDTDAQRVGAATAIINAIEHDFHEREIVLLGDFNDNPDDQSLNVLESGNPNAPGGHHSTGTFLINLCEPLVAADHVSWGQNTADVEGDHVRTVEPGSRMKNDDGRGTDDAARPILFDQLLISPALHANYVQDSAKVYDGADGARGNNTNRASDHLPVFADFVFADEPPPAPSLTVRITAVLPDPTGPDKGKESVTIENTTDASINLSGWRLLDLANNEFALSGAVPPHGKNVVVMATFSMPLNQSGDTIRLMQGPTQVHQVTYTASQVVEGQEITFN